VATFLQTQGRIGAQEMLRAVESNYVRLMDIMRK